MSRLSVNFLVLGTRLDGIKVTRVPSCSGFLFLSWFPCCITSLLFMSKASQSCAFFELRIAFTKALMRSVNRPHSGHPSPRLHFQSRQDSFRLLSGAPLLLSIGNVSIVRRIKVFLVTLLTDGFIGVKRAELRRSRNSTAASRFISARAAFWTAAVSPPAAVCFARLHSSRLRTATPPTPFRGVNSSSLPPPPRGQD